jgi:sulfate adenylyltransferase
MIKPHGGKLVDRYLNNEESQVYNGKLAEMKKITLDEIQVSDVDLIANGAMSPLKGFMCRNDYDRVISDMRLYDRTVWPIPVTLRFTEKEAENFDTGDEAALMNKEGTFIGVLKISDIFKREKGIEAASIYQTVDRNHPGVKYLYEKGDIIVGGNIKAVKRQIKDEFYRYRFGPAETRIEIERRGWNEIVAFQTRNPIHRAHEYLQKTALECVDGLLIHPLVGFTKPGDIPADVRLKCYEAIVEKYYPKDRVMLGVFPAAMRYAGPREAVFHAICRKNYGCTHIIIGRDHAGVGNYYGTYDAQDIFDTFTRDEIGIRIMKFEHSFFCKKCGNMASKKTCPHSDSDRIFLSGTKVREMLAKGENLPMEFTRPEVSEILKQYYQNMT